MPSKSAKQAKFMAACAHDAGYGSCPPKSVAVEFNNADAESGVMKDQRRVTAKGHRAKRIK